MTEGCGEVGRADCGLHPVLGGAVGGRPRENLVGKGEAGSSDGGSGLPTLQFTLKLKVVFVSRPTSREQKPAKNSRESVGTLHCRPHHKFVT